MRFPKLHRRCEPDADARNLKVKSHNRSETVMAFCVGKGERRSAYQRKDVGRPEPAERKDKDDCREHIGDWEHFQFNDAKSGRKGNKSTDRFEIIDHGRCCQRKDQLCTKEQGQEKDQMRNRDQGSDKPQRAGEQHSGKQIQNRFCKEDAMVAGHSRND